MFQLLTIICIGVFLMATFQTVKDRLDNIAAGVDRLEALIAELKAGQPVTQAQLDELGAVADAIGSDIDDPSDQG